MEYTVIKSRRRTMAIQIKDGAVIVRAPLRATGREIDAFVLRNSAWIETHLAKSRAAAAGKAAVEKLTDKELKALYAEAKKYIPERVRYYAPLIGVTYGRISIRAQHTRWGSCSSKGNLNFNCLLMLMPPEVIDSVVVHELCHRKEMNHSERFYAEVLRVMPDYKERRKWLKKNGAMFLARLPQ